MLDFCCWIIYKVQRSEQFTHAGEKAKTQPKGHSHEHTHTRTHGHIHTWTHAGLTCFYSCITKKKKNKTRPVSLVENIGEGGGWGWTKPKRLQANVVTVNINTNTSVNICLHERRMVLVCNWELNVCVCVRLSVVCSIAYADLLMSRHCNGLDVCCRMFVWPM